MADGETKKKRRLPAWMTTMHSQAKQREVASDSNQGVDPKDDKCAASRTCSANEIKKSSSSREDNTSTTTTTIAVPKSAAQLISEAMPVLNVPGKVIYIFQIEDCSCTCEEIISSLDRENIVPVGFDMEWPVSYKKGDQNKTALIQMYFPNHKCYLFQISGMKHFPKQLGQLICDENIKLVGLNIEPDLWKLERDFDVRVKPILDRGCVIDVGKMANEKLKSSERWDLNGLCKNVLGQQLNKDNEIRCGNWTDIPLSQEQIDYSSADAYAGFVLYDKLNMM